MMPTKRLDTLMQRALADKTVEPVFFRALLEATVYAHTPRAGHNGRLRLIQFALPDNGRMVLPFFSDEAQVRAAAGSAATIVMLTGRQLFEITRGATLMLNPNSTSCTLYPEEIAALLDQDEVAIVDQVEVREPKPMEFREPDPLPTWLTDPLIVLYAQLPSVQVAYLVEVRTPGDLDPERVGLLIVLGVPSMETERAARATITAIQPLCHIREIAVDLTAFIPGAPPGWIRDAVLAPFYVRSIGERLVAGSTATQ